MLLATRPKQATCLTLCEQTAGQQLTGGSMAISQLWLQLMRRPCDAMETRPLGNPRGAPLALTAGRQRLWIEIRLDRLAIEMPGGVAEQRITTVRPRKNGSDPPPAALRRSIPCAIVADFAQRRAATSPTRRRRRMTVEHQRE